MLAPPHTARKSQAGQGRAPDEAATGGDDGALHEAGEGARSAEECHEGGDGEGDGDAGRGAGAEDVESKDGFRIRKFLGVGGVWEEGRHDGDDGRARARCSRVFCDIQ